MIQQVGLLLTWPRIRMSVPGMEVSASPLLWRIVLLLFPRHCTDWTMCRLPGPNPSVYFLLLLSQPSVVPQTINLGSCTRAFSWLKAPISAFTFKTLLRQYAKQAPKQT